MRIPEPGGSTSTTCMLYKKRVAKCYNLEILSDERPVFSAMHGVSDHMGMSDGQQLKQAGWQALEPIPTVVPDGVAETVEPGAAVPPSIEGDFGDEVLGWCDGAVALAAEAGAGAGIGTGVATAGLAIAAALRVVVAAELTIADAAAVAAVAATATVIGVAWETVAGELVLDSPSCHGFSAVDDLVAPFCSRKFHSPSCAAVVLSRPSPFEELDGSLGPGVDGPTCLLPRPSFAALD